MKIAQQNHLSTNLAEINITPLVDVMLVLLIIFMVAAPMMQTGINIRLPTVETVTTPSSEGLTLTIDKERYIYMEKQIVNIQLLESRIKNYTFNTDKKIVFLRADEAIPYGFVMEVMDMIKKAGVDTVGLIVENKPKK